MFKSPTRLNLEIEMIRICFVLRDSDLVDVSVPPELKDRPPAAIAPAVLNVTIAPNGRGERESTDLPGMRRRDRYRWRGAAGQDRLPQVRRESPGRALV